MSLKEISKKSCSRSVKAFHGVSITADPVTTAVSGISDHCHSHLHAAIDLPGRLDPDLLQKSLLEVSSSLPELRGRFRKGFWRAVWELDNEPRWRIGEHWNVDPSSAEAIETELFARPFEPYGSLPIEMEIIHLSEHDRLLVRVNHFLADGGGAKNLLYRLATAYRSLSMDENWTFSEKFPRSHPLLRLLPLCRQVSKWDLVRGVFRDIAPHFGKPLLGIPTNIGACGPDRFISLHIHPDRVKKLKEVWSDNGVTLNDIALFALSRAIEAYSLPEEHDRCVLGAMVTADFRIRLPSLQNDVSNSSNLGLLHFAQAASLSDRDLLMEVVKQTSLWKKTTTGLGVALFALICASVAPHGLTRWCFSKLVARAVGISGRCIAMTNIGIIDEKRLNFGQGPCLAARITPPVGGPPHLLTALTGCAGGLDFSITWYEGALDPELPAGFIREFDSALYRLENP